MILSDDEWWCMTTVVVREMSNFTLALSSYSIHAKKCLFVSLSHINQLKWFSQQKKLLKVKRDVNEWKNSFNWWQFLFLKLLFKWKPRDGIIFCHKNIQWSLSLPDLNKFLFIFSQEIPPSLSTHEVLLSLWAMKSSQREV